MPAIFHDPALDLALADDGFVVVDLLDAAAILRLGRARETLGGLGPRGFSSTLLQGDVAQREAVDREIRRTIEPPLRDVLGGHRVAFCTFVAKAPDDAASDVPLHQDWSFVDERECTALGLWCPLVDVGVDNGCLHVVQGSHGLPHLHRAACTPFAYATLESELRRCLTAVPMVAGQAMVFDQRLFHGSPPNRSPTERVAATAVLVPGAARMRYYHVVDRADPGTVEVFDVDDAFFLRHAAGTRPRSGQSLGVFALSDLGTGRVG